VRFLECHDENFWQLSAGKAEKNEENRGKCEEKVGEADLVKSELLESFEDDPNFLFSSDIYYFHLFKVLGIFVIFIVFE